MKKCFSAMLIVAIVCFSIVGCSKGQQKAEPVTYSLESIYDDIYVVTYKVNSRVPAYNYAVADYCVNGVIYTIQGNVQIKYTNESPTAIYTQSDYIYGDSMTFYIPKDGVEYKNSIGV